MSTNAQVPPHWGDGLGRADAAPEIRATFALDEAAPAGAVVDLAWVGPDGAETPVGTVDAARPAELRTSAGHVFRATPRSGGPSFTVAIGPEPRQRFDFLAPDDGRGGEL